MWERRKRRRGRRRWRDTSNVTLVDLGAGFD